MIRLRLFVVCVLWVVSSVGCAAGREHAYHSATIKLQPAKVATHWVAIGVHDQREEVLRGEKGPEFVGLSRGGFGNAFDVTTEEEQPLAAAMCTSIARALKQAGYRVRVVPIDHSAPRAQAVRSLAGTGAARLLLVRLDHWKSDTYNRTALTYTVDVAVLDSQGNPLGQTSATGKDNLGGDLWDPASHAETAVPKAFAEKFQGLLSEPAIIQALGPSAPPSAPVTTASPSSPGAT